MWSIEAREGMRQKKASRSRHRRRLALASMLGALLAQAPVTAAVPKRSLPDYDGRGGEPKKPGDVALWVPRVLLFPFYVVSEYVVRRPLGALVSGAERAHVPEALYGFFMLSDDNKIGWVPTMFVDFGFKPSVGVYFFWKDAGLRDNRFSAHAATWGTDWLLFSLADRLDLDASRSVTLRGVALRRPDYRYYGPGPTSLEGQLSRYGATLLESSLSFAQHFSSSSRLELGAGVRHRSFHDPDPDYVSVRTRVAEGSFELPPSYARGYSAEFNRMYLRLDTRRPRPSSQTGLRLDLEAEQGVAPSTEPRGWVRYGAIAGGYLDLNDRARVLSLSVATQFSDSLTRSHVPFTEQVQLGGAELMRGFLPGRLYGSSAFVSTLSYNWPVWVWLDGSIKLAVGNVYDGHLRNLTPSSLRFSGALGVQTSVSSENPVEILVGFGTETFGQGANINTLRLAFGTSRGF